ncbi:hypothetical protein BA177_06125 [Woeseia oceani]|uniref:Uncharacterized protein n=1 Tax=Woeseia oceani TaxID=1548547 RepID=A0A193LEE8_9GAMM|nr:hypothetical protein BA177_06125 [Woeseia oceani]
MSKKGVIASLEKWPIIWRVTAPAAGSYDKDMVFCESDSREEALTEYRALRRAGWPVRVEQVRCGPLPKTYVNELKKIRERNAQNPGTTMREVPGGWTESA